MLLRSWFASVASVTPPETVPPGWWCRLWTHITEFSFCNIEPVALDAALNQVACPAFSHLKIKISKRHTVYPPRVSMLLAANTRLVLADIIFNVWWHTNVSDIAIEIRCFNRASSIKLDVVNIYLLPPAGVFSSMCWRGYKALAAASASVGWSCGALTCAC
jgi:hypothetical protein